MRKFLVIFVSLLAFLLFSSKKCDSPENKDANRDEIVFKTTLDSINSAFEADYLSDQMLRAFEVKANQKLADLEDYLQIYCDKSLDESFRDYTRQMIRDLFISDSVQINLNTSCEQKVKYRSIKEFLKTDFMQGKNSVDFKFDSIDLSEPLHRVNDHQYKGSLKFTQKHEVHIATNSAKTCSVSKRVDIIATKVRKQFGSDTLQIWKIFLGDIR